MASASGREEQHISLWRILAFGSVQLPLGMIGLPIAIYLAPLYSGQMQLALQLIGISLILARLSDFITDPMIGIISDRWRPKIGRRRVWLIFGSVTMMAGVYLLFRPSPGIDITYFLAAVALVYLGYTMLLLPYHAWAAELSEDYHVRTRISSVSQAFSIAGLITSTLIPAYVQMQPGMTSADVMSALSVVIITLLPLCAALAFFFVPEPEAPIRKAPFSITKALKMLGSNRAFLQVTVLVLVATVGEVFRQTITVFFARDVVGVPNIGVIYFLYFLAALLVVPGWVWLAKRIEKHRALALALVIVAATNALMFFVPKGGVYVFTALFILKGACYGAVLMLPHAMIADTADIDTADTLDRQQGLFYAVTAMVQKMGYAAGSGLPLLLLGSVGYVSAGESRAEPLLALTISYSVIPAVLVLIAAYMAWHYTLTEARHRDIRAEIDARMADASSGERIA
ncbi:MAG: MFS transporter [Sphingorhabdus sp.]|uniref:MFS transporter n=1 Tax=Sphingorhabdus sp. TaxID=1902408 RepID=UPI0034595A1A|nr:MFS transporter [Sphingorhabdus sp.]